MKRTALGRFPCSVARTMDLLGDWWTPLVLREVFAGVHRFDGIQRSLGIARNTLADRLARLVAEGLLDRVPYQEKPARHEYVLTEKGRDFFPVLAAMVRWGDKWLADDSGAPVALVHTCGHAGHARTVCSECGEPFTADTVTSRIGPGFPAELAGKPEVRARFT
ncbi:winged helix-turn-helix transcriptional regulator [Allokutzneria oryzae]|uniref:Winged helix-turn-helix transcriptional regulator n=1 Tax=Allokutzneria oryzae TaxID=1378989 RepID=A0ABV6AAM7_9PSEU